MLSFPSTGSRYQRSNGQHVGVTVHEAVKIAGGRSEPVESLKGMLVSPPASSHTSKQLITILRILYRCTGKPGEVQGPRGCVRWTKLPCGVRWRTHPSLHPVRELSHHRRTRSIRRRQPIHRFSLHQPIPPPTIREGEEQGSRGERIVGEDVFVREELAWTMALRHLGSVGREAHRGGGRPFPEE